MMKDRRDPARQHLYRGGQRHTDPMLTTREAGDCMDAGVDYVLGCIHEGVWSVKLGKMVQLPAEYLPGPNAKSNGEYRIYVNDFLVFLKQIGWLRTPVSLRQFLPRRKSR